MEDLRWAMGNGEKGEMDIGLEWFRMGNWPEHKHYECKLTESNFLPSMDLFLSLPLTIAMKDCGLDQK